MPHDWKWLVLILAYMAGLVRADPWDDFANNLFSDLAPLLALFGELTTMQFMSQSLGWEDCVVLAMAPLGIITILVSAIRVGGPAWLKAVIGRARENTSAAEMELMSSTSKEVCELYNGRTIVRCQGSTPVWEFIYLIPKASQERLNIKVITLEEACKKDKKLLRQDPPPQESPTPSTGKMERIFHKATASWLLLRTKINRDPEKANCTGRPTNEAIYVIRNMGSDAPNIILNLQSNNGNRQELWFCAMIGVILQLCVLVFFGIITYHPTIKNSFRKDDQHVDDYAFPLAISGTLVLALGVFLCGTIVEKSTDETHYKKNEHYEMRVVWIQQKQTVGDQVFEPFATFPGAPRDTVTMSRRRSPSKRQQLEPWTVIGICIGLAGFIIQFIGLRGMNSAATLAQLGAVGIMTAIRAWLRRGLAVPPQQEKLTSGFELDALAWALTLLNHSRGQGPQDLAEAGRLSLESQKNLLWSLWTGDEVDHRPFSSINPQSNPPTHPRAQQVFETRRNLSRLAQFKGASAAEAVNLATAMEKIMSVLFPLPFKEPEKAWTWPLPVAYSDSESSEPKCYVNISLTGKEGAWKVLADQLESVLSLCLFTAQKKEESRSKDDQSKFNLEDENDDWLRQKTMNSGWGIRIIGSTDAEKTDQLIQNLRWWAPETFDTLAEMTEIYGETNAEVPAESQGNQPRLFWKRNTGLEEGTRRELEEILKPHPKRDDILIDNNRVVGYGPARPQSEIKSTRQRHFQNFSALRPAEREERRRGTLAIESNDSLEKLIAKDLLFSFLLSAAKTLPTALLVEVTTREATPGTRSNDTSKVLVAKELTSMATEICRLGYGAEQEAWVSIIAPLSITERLPFPRRLVELAREGATEMLRNDKWWPATFICLDLWKQIQRLSQSAEKIRGWGTVFLVEYVCHLEYEMQRIALEGGTWAYSQLEGGARLVYENLRPLQHQQDFLAHLLRLYERQGRPIELENIKELAGSTLQGSFPDYFGLTVLHLRAMDPSIRSWDEEMWNAEAQAAIDERDIFDWTPLHWAASTRNGVAIKALAKRGANPNLKSLNGFTAVHYLCEGGYREDQNLWKIKWKLDACGLDGVTPMHIAARSGNLKFFESPGYWKLKFDLTDSHGRMPIHWAVMYGREQVVRHLKSTVDQQDKDGLTPLHLATLHHTSGSGMIRTVFQLSTDREKVDKDGFTPLLLACERRKLKAAHELIQVGADVNSATPLNATALIYAITTFEDEDFAQALVSRGAKVDIQLGDYTDDDPRTTILQFSVEHSRDHVVEILLGELNRLGPEARSTAIESKNTSGETALHIAASYKRLRSLKLLLLANADPNSKDNEGMTPLHHALVNSDDYCYDDGDDEEEQDVHLSIVKMLVEYDADPGAQNSDGQTPLDFALEGGFTDVAEYLRGVLKARKAASA